MRFQLIDRILDLEPGVAITTIKNLTMAEEYLAEHFPSFPVMPGVMMVEAVTQSAAWLLRIGDRFEHGITLLKEVRNAKFGQFVMPGKQLRIRVELSEDNGSVAELKAKGEIDGKSSVTGKFIVHRFSLEDRHPSYRALDERLREHHRRQFEMLASPELREKIETQLANGVLC